MDLKTKKSFVKMISLIDCLLIIMVITVVSINSNKNELADKDIKNKNITKTTHFAIKVNKEVKQQVENIEKNTTENKDDNLQLAAAENPEVAPKVEQPVVVYDGLTMEQLSAKLDRSLGSTLAGKGNLFATHSIELGLDPYLALAIVLHETGCKWNCSGLVKQCNNVGGQKGGPTCGYTSYKSYPTIDEGIVGFLDNLYYNYYAQGLTTPEAINTKYAESTTWAVKINNYINQIKAS